MSNGHIKCVTDTLQHKPRGARWWQVLLFVYASLIWIDRMHNIGGFKFENFSASDDKSQFEELLVHNLQDNNKGRTFENSMKALNDTLLKMCPLGTRKADEVLTVLRNAGAECTFLSKGEFLVRIDDPKETSYIWSCEYHTNPFLLNGHYRYSVAVCIDTYSRVLKIRPGISIYEHFFF